MRLRNIYGPRVETVLQGYIKPVPRAKRERQRYLVVTPLPSKAEYAKLEVAKFSCTLSSLVADAFAEAVALRDELTEWYDNLPDYLQNAADHIQAAIDALGEYCDSEPDIPEAIKDLRSVHFPLHTTATSRAARASECCAKLESCISMINDFLEERVGLKDACTEEIETLVVHLNAVSESWENVVFPSMYT